MSIYRRIHQLVPVRFKRLQGAELVDAHQAAITDDIRRQYCRKPARNGFL
jgi:hypothetical protein